MKATTAQFQRFLKSLVEMLKRENRYTWTLVFSFLFCLLTLGLPLWKILPSATLKPFIPLHYNVLFGIDRFGAWWQIFWIPAVCLLSMIVNVCLAALLYQKEKLLSTLLIVGLLFVHLVLFCSMTLIILVNL